MKQPTTMANNKGKDKELIHPLARSTTGYLENILTPVKLSGVVVPRVQSLRGSRTSEFNLTCASGLEYYFVVDSKWKDTLTLYCGHEVNVVGLLNIRNMTLIPQKVFPKGPPVEPENVIDLAAWRGKNIFRKLIESMDNNAGIPVAVLTGMAAQTI